MTKRYRAYDETIDRWRYFKIECDEKCWSLHYYYGITGDKTNTTSYDNFNAAYDNMLQLIKKMHLTKLTELNENDA